jgi:hypothetical protein
MIVSHLLLILHKKYSSISLCLKPEMWQKVAKFKGAEYFRKALYLLGNPISCCKGVYITHTTILQCTCVACVCSCLCAYTFVCTCVSLHTTRCSIKCFFFYLVFKFDSTACISYLMWNRVPCSHGFMLYCAPPNLFWNCEETTRGICIGVRALC